MLTQSSYQNCKWLNNIIVELKHIIIKQDRNSIPLSDTKIEDNSRGFKLQKANFDSEVNTAVSKLFYRSIGSLPLKALQCMWSLA